MVKHLKGKHFVKLPQKMSSNPMGRDNNKLWAFYKDYGHMTEDRRQLRWEIVTLIKKKKRTYERVCELRRLL